MKKNVLVTGGAGFIGSHLCRKLLDSGSRVICLDNFSTGHQSNIQELLTDDKFSILNHDITIPINIDVDEIYNLACPASPIHYQSDPINTMKTSVLGAINILELARSTNAKVFQASTSEIYGDPELSPQDEEYWGHVNPIGIRSCYDEGKRCAESLFFDYYRQHSIDIRLVRIFNTYGPNMRPGDGRVVSNFISQALKNQDITIYGNGNQTRSFLYIDDLIEGIVSMMHNDSSFTGPLNLGNQNEVTMNFLAEKILEYIPNSTSNIVYRKLPEDDPKHRKPDITLANNILNWQPTVNLDNGLNNTINYIRKYLNV